MNSEVLRRSCLGRLAMPRRVWSVPLRRLASRGEVEHHKKTRSGGGRGHRGLRDIFRTISRESGNERRVIAGLCRSPYLDTGLRCGRLPRAVDADAPVEGGHAIPGGRGRRDRRVLRRAAARGGPRRHVPGPARAGRSGSPRPGWPSRAPPATSPSRRRPTVLAADLRAPFDVVILSCKAYDLDAAIESVAPAVGPDTAVLPLLNGMRHLDALDARFGPGRVLGGSCFISARLDDAGRVAHVSDIHRLVFGERAGGRSPRVDAIAAAMAGAKFEAVASDQIVLEMWEKWVFLAALAGITCLTRSAVGDVVAAGGADLAAALLEECRAVAVAAGYPPRPESLQAALGGSPTPARR